MQMRLLRIFYRNIKRIFYWLPIIWNDRDYDQVFFFKIMYHKLLSMKKFFGSNDALWLYSKKAEKDIDKALKILERMIADKYDENAFMWHDKKWGNLNTSTVKLPNGNFKFNVVRENVITEKDKEVEKKEFHRCFEHAEKQKKQDLEYLFRILNKYVYEWWD